MKLINECAANISCYKDLQTGIARQFGQLVLLALKSIESPTDDAVKELMECMSQTGMISFKMIKPLISKSSESSKTYLLKKLNPNANMNLLDVVVRKSSEGIDEDVFSYLEMV